MLDAVVLTVNGIVPEVPMIISNTFNTLRRTPTGISLSIPFMKSPNERYKSNEIVPAFDQVSKSISATVLDSPGSIKEGELLIQEIDTLGNVVNEFTPDSLPSYFANPSSKEFIVRWQPDGDIYDSFSNSFGDLPSERFPTKSVTDSAQRYLYDTEVTHSSTGLINQLFTYGRYDKALENEYTKTS